MSQSLIFIALLALVLLLVLFAAGLYRSRKREERIRETVERKNIENEVSVLKNQMSPHFILNTINNISSLMDYDKERAKELLIKFGDLLRYSTYEVKNHKVKLASTLDYLDKYLELQQLRFGDKEVLRYSVQGSSEGKHIAPMILLPFIENAFKYGARYGKDKPAISIDITIEENNLCLMVGNYIKSQQRYVDKGIGIKNTTKRLKLIYPNQHNLDIYNDGTQFNVKLEIKDLSNGEENKLYSS